MADTLNTIKKINTTDGSTTGNSYLTNVGTISVGGQEYNITNGFNFGNVPTNVQEAAKYKKSLNIGNNIPNVTLDDSIVLIEKYDEANRYAYSEHAYTTSSNTQTTIKIPKRLTGWQYDVEGSLVDLPSTLNNSIIGYFDATNNLDVFAKWKNDVKAIRVIVFPMRQNRDAIPGIVPTCTVTITTTNSYSGNGALTNNYKKLYHRKANASDQINSWAFFSNEFGTGNGCPDIDSDGYDSSTPVPCYYGFKNNDNITIALTNFNATYNGTALTNVYKPLEVNGTPKFKEASVLSAYYDYATTPDKSFTSSTIGTYTIFKNNLATDLTVFVPVVPNTYTIYVTCEDSTPASAKGLVDLVSLMRSTNPVAFQITANCVNSETVEISATPNQGYIFSHWKRTRNGNEETFSQSASFTLPIEPTVNGDVYTAYFTTGTYTLTYHKEVL